MLLALLVPEATPEPAVARLRSVAAQLVRSDAVAGALIEAASPEDAARAVLHALRTDLDLGMAEPDVETEQTARPTL